MAQISRRRRSVVAHPKFAKGIVVQNRTKRIDGLLQDFLSMGHEKQSVTRIGIIEPLVVESRNHRFSRTCCRNNQVSVAVMNLPFHRQLIKDGLLVGQHMILLQHTPRGPVHLISFGNGSHKAVIVIILEVIAVPVSVECGKCLLDDMRILLIGNAHIPLQSLCQRRARNVRRTNVSRIHATFPYENVRFGMQPV